MTRLIAVLLWGSLSLALGASGVAAAADAAPPVDPPAPSADPDAEEPAAKEVPPPPTFAPGAEVKLEITLLPPPDWVLNYMVPLRLQFDEEQLKQAPFKVSKAVWDFSFDKYLPRYTATIPLKLAKPLPDGPLEIPLQVLCSICTAAGDECTFAIEPVDVEIIVQATAEPDAKNQALSKGSLALRHALSIP